MGLLTLYSGLLLPWLGGTLWLAFADSRFNSHSQINRFRQVGYGFFLGYAILFVAILVARKLTGAVPWTGLMLFLVLFSLSGGVAAWRYKAPAISQLRTSQTELTTSMKILLGIMLVLMSVHLVFITIEIYSH